jgi:hypothetical protein
MKLSPYERETILLYNEAEDLATVYTHNARLQQRLADLAVSFPDSFRLQERNGSDGVTYLVDKKLILIRQPYSEERRQKDRERALARNLIPPGNRRQQRAAAQKRGELSEAETGS